METLKVWKSIESAPEGEWVLGYYPNDPWAPVWTVRLEGGFWYGDHHASEYATDKERPLLWAPLPIPEVSATCLPSGVGGPA